ncbi:hypothetical protein B0H17DRAFT_1205147 [Mycena rosella]|uniref:Uncharacterized protein n=1 Tax=Mycena rosella TaxID=1033263 RepID=A0AAD7GD28_MYCRO|nr:hypothetical protein B0H17DRAFT_1205147 [Mycena rosella]
MAPSGSSVDTTRFSQNQPAGPLGRQQRPIIPTAGGATHRAELDKNAASNQKRQATRHRNLQARQASAASGVSAPVLRLESPPQCCPPATPQTPRRALQALPLQQQLPLQALLQQQQLSLQANPLQQRTSSSPATVAQLIQALAATTTPSCGPLQQLSEDDQPRYHNSQNGPPQASVPVHATTNPAPVTSIATQEEMNRWLEIMQASGKF